MGKFQVLGLFLLVALVCVSAMPQPMEDGQREARYGGWGGNYGGWGGNFGGWGGNYGGWGHDGGWGHGHGGHNHWGGW